MSFKRSVFEPHPEGATVGKFVDWVHEPEGEFGPQIRASFDTRELMKDGRPFRVSFWVTDRVNPRSNAFRLLRAFGLDPDRMSDAELLALDLDTFIGREVQLVVEHRKRPDGSITAKVTNILPLRSPSSTESNRDGPDGGADPFDRK